MIVKVNENVYGVSATQIMHGKVIDVEKPGWATIQTSCGSTGEFQLSNFCRTHIEAGTKFNELHQAVIDAREKNRGH